MESKPSKVKREHYCDEVIRFTDNFTFSFLDPMGNRCVPAPDLVIKTITIFDTLNPDNTFPLLKEPLSLFGFHLKTIQLKDEDLGLTLEINGSVFLGSVRFDIIQSIPRRFGVEIQFDGHILY
jgi:hypothetical protein